MALSMEGAHAAAAEALAKVAAGAPTHLGDGSSPSQPDPATPSGGDAAVDAVLRELGADIQEETPAADPKTAPQKPAVDSWERLKTLTTPDTVLKLLDNDANARAALAAANQRNHEAGLLKARAEEAMRLNTQNLRDIQRLARKDPTAAAALLDSMEFDEVELPTGGGARAPQFVEATDEDGRKVRVRLPKEMVDRVAQVDDLQQRVGNFEAHSYAQGVRGLVTQALAKHQVFADLEVVPEVTNTIVGAIVNDRSVTVDTLEQRVNELVEQSAKRSDTLAQKIIKSYLKGKSGDQRGAAPPMRGGGGTPPAPTESKAPRLGKGASWDDIHRFAAKVHGKLREHGLT